MFINLYSNIWKSFFLVSEKKIKETRVFPEVENNSLFPVNFYPKKA
jgi:hypothetical protein